jgi:hypothetical protein
MLRISADREQFVVDPDGAAGLPQFSNRKTIFAVAAGTKVVVVPAAVGPDTQV